jgi:hypothetical protein
MKRTTAGAAAMIWLVLAAAAAAQGPDEAVLLRYRFQPGQEFRYRMTLTGDMGMTMGGVGLPPGAVPPKIPVTMKSTYEMVQKVKSVSPEGVATVSIGFDKLDTAMAFMGMNVTSRVGSGGKVETLMNGQPMPTPGGADVVLPNPLAEVTIDPTGKVTGANPDSLKALNQLAGGQNLTGMFGGNMPGMGGLILPSQPVKPGDTWESKSAMQMPVPLPAVPGGPPGAAPVFAVNYTFRNKLVRVEEGRALIETRITALVPPGSRVPMGNAAALPPGLSMTIARLEQSITGTQRFAIEGGTVESGDFDATMASQMNLVAPASATPSGKPAPRQPPARAGRPGSRTGPPKSRPAPSARPAPPTGAPAGLKIGVDGTMKLQLERLATPEAAAAQQVAPGN